MKVVVVVGALLASFPSCPDLYTLATHEFSVPTIELSPAEARSNSSAITVSVSVQAHNRNRLPLTVTGIDYDVLVEAQPAFSGAVGALTVPEEGAASFSLAGSLSAASSRPLLLKLRSGQTARYIVSGTVHIDSPAGAPLEVDFSSEGTLIVPPLPPLH